jgi:hypothetical protein
LHKRVKNEECAVFQCCPFDFLVNQITLQGDVFAFGVLLWELWHLMQKQPKLSLSGKQHIEKMIAGNRPAISDSVHPIIAELIANCWQRRREQRPKMSTVVAILEKFYDQVLESSSSSSASSASSAATVPKAKMSKNEEGFEVIDSEDLAFQLHDNSEDAAVLELWHTKIASSPSPAYYDEALRQMVDTYDYPPVLEDEYYERYDHETMQYAQEE